MLSALFFLLSLARRASADATAGLTRSEDCRRKEEDEEGGPRSAKREQLRALAGALTPAGGPARGRRLGLRGGAAPAEEQQRVVAAVDHLVREPRRGRGAEPRRAPATAARAPGLRLRAARPALRAS